MLEKTILVILPIIGFALFTSAYMYSSIILLKNYPFPLDVVYIALTESRFNLFHIIQVDNEDNSVHSLKRIEDRYSSKLVCFSPYEACSTGLSDDNKKNGSTYLITKNTDSMPIMLGGSHNNGLRNHLNKDFSMIRKPSVKAASVLKNSYYSLKREIHLSRSSKNRINPTSKKKEGNTSGEQSIFSDSFFTEHFDIIIDTVPANLTIIHSGELKIGSSNVILSHHLPHEQHWFTETYNYNREDWFF